MKHILVVGSVNADLVIQTPRMPRMGETVRGGGFCVNTGGKGANLAAAYGDNRNAGRRVYRLRAARLHAKAGQIGQEHLPVRVCADTAEQLYIAA